MQISFERTLCRGSALEISYIPNIEFSLEVGIITRSNSTEECRALREEKLLTRLKKYGNRAKFKEYEKYAFLIQTILIPESKGI